MDDRLSALASPLQQLDGLLSAAAPSLGPERRQEVERWRGDASALRFHLSNRTRAGSGPALVAVLGGTGTGKSTLVNRLAGASICAASFRRTHTSGPVAVVPRASAVPVGWLGVERVDVAAGELPARGRAGALLVALREADRLPVLIDTPDLDGDQPAHHAQADRVFRWAQATLFLVTPEKYQMTELLGYYRLASRYGIPSFFVMNKCQEHAVADDYRRQLEALAFLKDGGSVYALPRDDSAYEPPAERGLAALREALAGLGSPAGEPWVAGLRARCGDLLVRLDDQLLAPMRADRGEADTSIASLRSMEAPAPGIDVNPVTRQLHRRLQQRSVLYLMGPGRVLDRVRHAPVLLARLPRFAWDYLKTGQASPELLNPTGAGAAPVVPNFRALLIDQFAVLQSRIDDALRAGLSRRRWPDAVECEGADAPWGASPWCAARIDPELAGRIADEELADLQTWLERKWNATPRDTRSLEGLLRLLPGGRGLSRWTEAAPYLLTVVLLAAHSVMSGGTDMLLVGGYTLATWISERLSNEVTGRTRATNAHIESRFAELAHEQIARVCDWLDRQAMTAKALDEIESVSERIRQAIE